MWMQAIREAISLGRELLSCGEAGCEPVRTIVDSSAHICVQYCCAAARAKVIVRRPSFPSLSCLRKRDFF